MFSGGIERDQWLERGVSPLTVFHHFVRFALKGLIQNGHVKDENEVKR